MLHRWRSYLFPSDRKTYISGTYSFLKFRVRLLPRNNGRSVNDWSITCNLISLYPASVCSFGFQQIYTLKLYKLLEKQQTIVESLLAAINKIKGLLISYCL